MSQPLLLIVDDEENLRSMLRAALRHHGFDVVEAADGRAALDMAAEHEPDLIVMDVMMPELDGFEACRRLRANGEHTPVLFLTAKGETADRVRGLKLGGDDYLDKPFSLDELVARIEAVLRRSGHRADDNRYEIADLVLDDDAHLVTRDGEEIALSPTEYNLLRYFYRADPSRSRASGGSGLGLAIVKAVVEAHGGDLSIRSDVVTGTTVGITLPRSAR